MLSGWLPLRAALGLALAALALSACGPATYNVRASRAFSNEDADLAVTTDRAADLDRALALVDELLLRTPYTPGDGWIQKLRLDDDRGDALKKRFEDAQPYNGDYEVPIVKLYRVHLEQVLGDARKERRAGAAEYPSILHAIGVLSPAARPLPETWAGLLAARKRLFAATRRVDALRVDMLRKGLRRAPPALAAAEAEIRAAQRDIANAQKTFANATAAIREKKTEASVDYLISRDALDMLSFALRMNIEASAVAPYVAMHAKRLARDDAKHATIAVRAEEANALAEVGKEALEPLTSALSVPARTSLDLAAGYAMHEGLLTQAFKINLDATHAHVKADTELLFFNPLASNVASGGINDYTGRTRRLSYSIDPVFMVGGRVMAAYDFLHVKNAASLNAGFTTDRLFSSGGTIENNNSLGTLLGIEGFASDMFDLGVGLLGVRTNVRLAQFTTGEVTEISVDPATGLDIGEIRKAPLQVRYSQIDVGYDLSSFAPELAEALNIESFMMGFRYMDYRLPRVLYELVEKNPGTDSLYVLSRESPPQTMRSRFYMGGFVARFGRGEWPRIAPYGDIGIYGGAGPVNYYFFKDASAPDSPVNRRDESATMLALDGVATLGLRFRLTPRLSRFRVITELSYHAELVAQGIVSEIREQRRENQIVYSVGKKLDVGGVDLFHGPRLMLVGVF